MDAKEILEEMRKEDRLLSESAVMKSVQKALIGMGYEPLGDEVQKIFEAIENTPKAKDWIPCSERLPELTEGTECFNQSKCCLVTLKWWDGDMTESVGWYNQSGVWSEDSENCKVVAWQPLPPAYQPEGTK